MTNKTNNNQRLTPNILEEGPRNMRAGVGGFDELLEFQDREENMRFERMLEKFRGVEGALGGGAGGGELGAAQAAAAGARAPKANQADLDFKAEDEPEQAEKLDLQSILLRNMTAEELFALKPINGSVSKKELDYVKEQAEKEGKIFTYSKSGKEVIGEDGRATTQEVEGKIDGRAEITAKNGEILAAGYFDFDASVPMTRLSEGQAPANPVPAR